jgi:hypothetical protein
LHEGVDRSQQEERHWLRDLAWHLRNASFATSPLHLHYSTAGTLLVLHTHPHPPQPAAVHMDIQQAHPSQAWPGQLTASQAANRPLTPVSTCAVTGFSLRCTRYPNKTLCTHTQATFRHSTTQRCPLVPNRRRNKPHRHVGYRGG